MTEYRRLGAVTLLRSDSAPHILTFPSIRHFDLITMLQFVQLIANNHTRIVN